MYLFFSNFPAHREEIVCITESISYPPPVQQTTANPDTTSSSSKVNNRSSSPEKRLPPEVKELSCSTFPKKDFEEMLQRVLMNDYWSMRQIKISMNGPNFSINGGEWQVRIFDLFTLEGEKHARKGLIVEVGFDFGFVIF
jgi:hypothetical protein